MTCSWLDPAKRTVRLFLDFLGLCVPFWTASTHGTVAT